MLGGIFTEANNLVARGVAVILYPTAVWFLLRWAVSRHAPDGEFRPGGADEEIEHGERQ